MTKLSPQAVPAAKKPKKRRAKRPRTWIEIIEEKTRAVPASCLECGQIVQARNYPHGYKADLDPVSRWWLDMIPERVYWEWRERQGYGVFVPGRPHHVCPPYIRGEPVPDAGPV